MRRTDNGNITEYRIDRIYHTWCKERKCKIALLDFELLDLTGMHGKSNAGI